MPRREMLTALLLVLLAGCEDHWRTLWHGERVAPGAAIKVVSFQLVWGIEHDRRDVARDGFALEYVSAHPHADATQREAEALQAFELMRPVLEQWGFRSASLAAFPTLARKGHYDVHQFDRGPDGRWTFKRSDAKVFVTD